MRSMPNVHSETTQKTVCLFAVFLVLLFVIRSFFLLELRSVVTLDLSSWLIFCTSKSIFGSPSQLLFISSSLSLLSIVAKHSLHTLLVSII